MTSKSQLVQTRTRRQEPEARVAAEAERPLSPACAFVVQFREATEVARERFSGRVEHMISGSAARFRSPEELLAFFTRVLSAARTTLPDNVQETGAPSALSSSDRGNQS